MTQKGIAPLLLILGLTIILIISASISFFNTKKSAVPFPSAAASAVPEARKDTYYSSPSAGCGEEVNKVISTRGITDIKNCSQRIFELDGKPVIFGIVEYGKIVCSEVCRQPSQSFVIEDGKVTDLPPFSLFDAEQKIYKQSGWLCQYIFNGIDTNEAEGSARLIRNKTGYSWEINLGKYSNPLCGLRGTLVQPEDEFTKGDLIISTNEIDCGNENQLKAICTKAGVACKTDIAEDYLCHYVRAQFGQELNTCDNPNVARVKCEQKYGNSSGKCNSATENKITCMQI